MLLWSFSLASVAGRAIIAAYGGDPHGEPRFRANPYGGSTVVKTGAGKIGVCPAARAWVGAHPGLRTLDWLERSRVACLSRLCIRASARSTTHPALAHQPREKIAARCARRTGCFTRRKRPYGLGESESQLH